MSASPSDPRARLNLMRRTSRRISFTVPFRVYTDLIQVSDHQGRSVSNLCAFLVEGGLHELKRSIPSLS